MQHFNVLQQRLNRKVVTPKLLVDYPAHLRSYDILAEERRGPAPPRLLRAPRAAGVPRRTVGPDHEPIDLSAQVPFASWEELAVMRADPAAAGRRPRRGRHRGPDAEAEGFALPARPSQRARGGSGNATRTWVDAVMMYAQRGHGKRSSFYSDYTFGVWRTRCRGGEELVPVGKAYSGFTDQELAQARPLRPQQHRQAVRPGSGGRPTASRPGWCWRSRSRGCSARRGTSPAWRCDFPGSAASAGTSRPRRPTGSNAGANPREGRDRADPADTPWRRPREEGHDGRVDRLASGPVARQASGRLTSATPGPGFTDITAPLAAFVHGSGITGRGRRPLLPAHLGVAHHPGECRPRRPDGPAGSAGRAGAPAGRLRPRRRGTGRHAGPYPHAGHRFGAHRPAGRGRLALGTWQGIYLIEHRDRPHRREIVLSAIGA